MTTEIFDFDKIHAEKKLDSLTEDNQDETNNNDLSRVFKGIPENNPFTVKYKNKIYTYNPGKDFVAGANSPEGIKKPGYARIRKWREIKPDSELSWHQKLLKVGNYEQVSNELSRELIDAIMLDPSDEFDDIRQQFYLHDEQIGIDNNNQKKEDDYYDSPEGRRDRERQDKRETEKRQKQQDAQAQQDREYQRNRDKASDDSARSRDSQNQSMRDQITVAQQNLIQAQNRGDKEAATMWHDRLQGFQAQLRENDEITRVKTLTNRLLNK